MTNPAGEIVGTRRILVAASFNWMPAARLALALREAGFTVDAVCPPGHVMEQVGFVREVRRVGLRSSLARLRSAIEAAAPDLVVPCDDRMAARLREMHQRAGSGSVKDEALRTLIVRSLGDLAGAPSFHDRAAIMAIARTEGLRAPLTAAVPGRAALGSWLDRHGPLAVLKTDGSWGGNGVALVRDRAEALAAFDRLSAPPSLPRVIKRLLVDGDPTYLGDFVFRRRATVSVQAFVEGRPGNAAVACRDGQVLGAVYVEVLRAAGATGPATVVQVIEHPAMARAVEAMVRRLRLSGFCGFDFIIEAGGEKASLIELNPRATPTCHLTAADGADLAAALRASLEGAPPPRRAPTYENGLVALFPQEMMRDPASPFLSSAHHDLPSGAPELVERGLAMVRGPGRMAARMMRRPPRDKAWGV